MRVPISKRGGGSRGTRMSAGAQGSLWFRKQSTDVRNVNVSRCQDLLATYAAVGIMEHFDLSMEL